MKVSPGTLRRFLKSSLLWGGISLVLLLLGLFLAWKTLSQGDVLRQQAFDSARRIGIEVADGEMLGVPPAVPAPAPPAKEEMTQPPPPQDMAEEGAAEATALPAKPDAETGAEEPPAPAETPEHPQDHPAGTPPEDTPPEETHDAPEASSAPGENAAPVFAPAESAESLQASGLLAQAPAEIVSEQTEAGVLPKIAEDGTRPWQYYARPFIRPKERPVIAIVLTGVGLNKNTSDQAMTLSENVTLSLSPYSHNARIWAKSIRIHGHEILIDLPLEPMHYPAVDPGPDGFLTHLKIDENLRRLENVLARFPGYIGVTIPEEERFTMNKEAAYPVMQNVNKRGLLFFLSVIPDKSVENLFKYNSFPYLTSDLILDRDLSPAAIDAQLAKLEEISRRQGYAIGTARALPVTLSRIGEWQKTLPARNAVLAPLSAIAKMKFQ